MGTVGREPWDPNSTLIPSDLRAVSKLSSSFHPVNVVTVYGEVKVKNKLSLRSAAPGPPCRCLVPRGAGTMHCEPVMASHRWPFPGRICQLPGYPGASQSGDTATQHVNKAFLKKKSVFRGVWLCSLPPVKVTRIDFSFFELRRLWSARHFYSLSIQ